MDKSPNTSGLMTANFIMHFISACLAGVWIADLVSSSGAMTPLAWFETALAVIAISVGLSVCTYIAMRHIPMLPLAQRRRAKMAFIAAYAVLALVLASAAASVLAAPAGERAHQEYALQEMKLICPLLSGPESLLFWTTKEEWNGEETQAGRDHRQAA